MFDKKMTDEYKTITPPDNMKENILRKYAEKEQKKTHFRLKQTVGIAASFAVLILTVVLYLGNNAPFTIVGSGEKITDKPIEVKLEQVPLSSKNRSVSMFSIEEIAPECIAFDINIKKQCEISVSDGVLLVYNSEADNFFPAGKSFAIEKSSRIYWSIGGLPKTDSFTLNIIVKEKIFKFSLFFDNEKEMWIFAKNNK